MARGNNNVNNVNSQLDGYTNPRDCTIGPIASARDSRRATSWCLGHYHNRYRHDFRDYLPAHPHVCEGYD